jgi:hypothetical protein
MPRSKHRRKPSGKAVVHPGRNRPGKPLRAWLDMLDNEQEPDLSDLPLFAWAGRAERTAAPGGIEGGGQSGDEPP